jgi:hypothetical protein
VSLLHAFVRAYPGRSILGLMARSHRASAVARLRARGRPRRHRTGRLDRARRVVVDSLRAIRVEATTGALLSMIVADAMLESASTLLANRQAGHAARGLATAVAYWKSSTG